MRDKILAKLRMPDGTINPRLTDLRRQSDGRRRSVNLGVDVLPGFERDYSAAVGLVFGAVGEEAVLHAVRGAVHGEFIFVRACTEPECAGAVPDSARRGWRWLAA